MHNNTHVHIIEGMVSKQAKTVPDCILLLEHYLSTYIQHAASGYVFHRFSCRPAEGTLQQMAPATYINRLRVVSDKFISFTHVIADTHTIRYNKTIIQIVSSLTYDINSFFGRVDTEKWNRWLHLCEKCRWRCLTAEIETLWVSVHEEVSHSSRQDKRLELWRRRKQSSNGDAT